MTPMLQSYQRKIIEIGEVLGYETRRSYKKSAMGDAIWLDRRSTRFAEDALPVVAFKILTFETRKEIREAIATLQAISPALGVLVVLEDAYARRGASLKKYTAESYPEHIRKIARQLAEGIQLTFRTLVWGQSEVDQLYQDQVEGRLRFP